MRCPLGKRAWRELRDDWRKYLVISLFLILTIGFVSGMYVANGSMMATAEESAEKYKLEDGHFTLESEASDDLLATLEQEDQDQPAQIYRNYYREETEIVNQEKDANRTVRVYPVRTQVNLADVMEGSLPEAKNEIAIDRMHADNAGIQIGDTLEVGSQKFKVSGLIASVDYSTLFQDNSDMMFDAIQFDVAVVTREGFDRLNSRVHYNYAWVYDHEPKDEIEEKEQSDEFLETLVQEAALSGNVLEDYLPAYRNQAIHFATDDMGSDKAMGGVILYILMAVIAFIFAITISSTITREAVVIGTLRASGYTRKELLHHYMTPPIIITLAAALLGNILGYTLFQNIVVSMYYNSYSLPSFETVWSTEAFLRTTMIPLVLMIVVNELVLRYKLRLSPLQFLRKDLKRKASSRVLKLPPWKFIRRFRIRILLQNVPNYLMMFVGIYCVMVLMAMVVGMPQTLDHYQENAAESMVAKHQVFLKTTTDESGAAVTTDNEDAEPFSVRTLLLRNEIHEEDVIVYGVPGESRYVTLPEDTSDSTDEAYLSIAYQEKYGVQEGDTISLREQYEDKEYKFKVRGIVESGSGLAVFLPNDSFNRIFGEEEGSWNALLSDTEITDIPEEYIAQEVTEESILKVVRQLNHSMGDYMAYFQYLCAILAAVLLYLLTKLIIEKNETAISMTKILGCSDREIAMLYLSTTSGMVILFDLLSLAAGYQTMRLVWHAMMMRMEGWFDLYLSPAGFARMFLFVLVGYFFVMLLDYRRIRRIPLSEALKDIE